MLKTGIVWILQTDRPFAIASVSHMTLPIIRVGGMKWLIIQQVIAGKLIIEVLNNTAGKLTCRII